VSGVVERYRTEPPPVIRRHRCRPADRATAARRHRLVRAPRRHRGGRRRAGAGDVLGAIVSSDEVPHGKPAPDVYLVAASQLGVDPGRCLVVEDSVNGVKAGKAAGMYVVLIPNASVPPPAGTAELADAVVDTLADLDPDRLGG
jgi:beta-phosphoglucomutase-like phosphatase (HAD superfamily)